MADGRGVGLSARPRPGRLRSGCPCVADDAVRPYLAAHAFFLGGFTGFCQLGSFSRLTLAWRVYGRDRMNGEIGRIRLALAWWGYRLGCGDNTLLPMVACQVFLLNRSPHLEELGTAVFDRIRSEQLLPGVRLNTLHAMQRAVAYLGFCDQPVARADRRPGPGRRRVRPNGRDGWTGGTPLSRSLPCNLVSAAVSAPRCSKPGARCGRASRGRRPKRTIVTSPNRSHDGVRGQSPNPQMAYSPLISCMQQEQRISRLEVARLGPGDPQLHPREPGGTELFFECRWVAMVVVHLEFNLSLRPWHHSVQEPQ